MNKENIKEFWLIGVTCFVIVAAIIGGLTTLAYYGNTGRCHICEKEVDGLHRYCYAAPGIQIKLCENCAIELLKNATKSAK